MTAKNNTLKNNIFLPKLYLSLEVLHKGWIGDFMGQLEDFMSFGLKRHER